MVNRSKVKPGADADVSVVESWQFVSDAVAGMLEAIEEGRKPEHKEKKLLHCYRHMQVVTSQTCANCTTVQEL